MAWRMVCLAVTLVSCGLGCGRTETIFAFAETEPGSSGNPGTTSGSVDDTGRPDSGSPTTVTDGPGTGGPITVTATTGFDTGIEETGFPGTSTTSTTSTTGTSTTTTGPMTSTSPGTTDGGTTDGGTTDGGTTDGGTTDPGTTDGGTTDGGTTDGGTTDGGTTVGGSESSTGGDPTCQDAVDCVIACGDPSPACVNMCDGGLSPGESADFNSLRVCIVLNCFFNGSCGGGLGDPVCEACRFDGFIDPATVGCAAEGMACG